MTFQQLTYVVEISKCGSINKAAHKLFLSQSGISTAVRELEEELGIQFFVRSNRGVEFTPEGKELSSESFAKKLAEVKLTGKSSACFLIGSSFGMSLRVKEKADFKLSMGPMTFPHHLARIMVLEQIYRAEAIQAGSKYHK